MLDVVTFAFAPIAIEFLKLLPETSALYPIAVLLLPTLTPFNVLHPIAVLFKPLVDEPVIRLFNTLYPIAVLFPVFIPAFVALPDKSPINFVFAVIVFAVIVLAVTLVNDGVKPIPGVVLNEISVEPSNVWPSIINVLFNFDAVLALPDKSPIYVFAVTILNVGVVVSPVCALVPSASRVD